MAGKNLSKDKESDYITSEQYENALKSDDYAKFADTFNEEKTQKLIQDSINKLILKAIACDHETRAKLKEIIKEVEKEDFKSFLRKIGTLLGGALIYILGLLTSALVSWFMQTISKR